MYHNLKEENDEEGLTAWRRAGSEAGLLAALESLALFDKVLR